MVNPYYLGKTHTVCMTLKSLTALHKSNISMVVHNLAQSFRYLKVIGDSLYPLVPHRVPVSHKNIFRNYFSRLLLRGAYPRTVQHSCNYGNNMAVLIFYSNFAH